MGEPWGHLCIHEVPRGVKEQTSVLEAGTVFHAGGLVNLIYVFYMVQVF